VTRLAALAFALVAAGCAEGVPRYTMSVRALGPPSPLGVARGGVTVAASAITRATWLEHRAVVSRIYWRETDSGSQVRGGLGGAAPVTALQEAEVALMPLPSFEVRIVNHTGQPLAMRSSRAELDDGHGRRFAWITDADEIERRVESDVTTRYRALLDSSNRASLAAVREAFAGLKLLTPALTIPDGGDWQGYLTFDLEARSTEEMRAFMLEARALTLRLAGLAPDGSALELRFPILRKPPAVVSSEPRFSPTDDGPCILQTIKLRTVAGTQWWMGSTPVANSDLHRTLLAAPVTRAPMRRGLILRAVGYSLIGAGLLATAIAAPIITERYGSTYGPAATGFAAISLAGFVPAFLGVRASDQAIRLYNEQADATGLCVPVM
jgi:hypothetical protein